jgi:hypothetical protein
MTVSAWPSDATDADMERVAVAFEKPDGDLYGAVKGNKVALLGKGLERCWRS